MQLAVEAGPDDQAAIDVDGGAEDLRPVAGQAVADGRPTAGGLYRRRLLEQPGA